MRVLHGGAPPCRREGYTGMNRLNVALLFGGVSSEHEVSRVSAKTFADHLSEDKYRVYKIGITKDGRWLYYPGPSSKMPDGSWELDEGCQQCILSPDRADHGLLLRGRDGQAIVLPVDLVIPVLHGKNGEDGTVQGLLELAGLPYVGCGVLASAVCMDKAVANTLLDAAGVPRCQWTWADRAECADFDALEARVSARLGYPVFVKPANAGSSVGISKAADSEALRRAVAVALAEDDKVVFERLVTGQEVECAVLGNGPAASTRPGEILASEEFYTYEDKYLLGTSRTVIPAHLAPEKLDEVKAIAERAYAALGCQGLARCDFFVEKDGTVLINEVNTMPGFTAISMYPKLMEEAGTPLPLLVDRLVQLALERAGVRHG